MKQLTQCLRRTTLLLGIVLCAGLSGCLEAGLGDPASAPAEARLEGLWQMPDKGDQLLVRPWGDGHTYAISEVKTASDGGARTVERVYKAWLAKVGDRTFITLDTSPGDLEKTERPFMVAQIEFKGADVSAKALDAEFVATAKTPAALEKLVRENLQNPKLFAKEETVYKRVPAK